MIKLLNWLLPNTCLVCSLPTNRHFCPPCFQELPWIVNPCLTCAIEMLPSSLNQCGECMIHPPAIDRAIVLFRYQGAIISLINQLKFRKKLLIAQPLGELLANHIPQVCQNDLPSLILPVPLHLKRLRARGYNQALEIARPIKKVLGIPIDYKHVKRTKMTAPQTLIEANERALNVRRAFSVVKEFAVDHIAIVDDVTTTFSTVNELAKTLKQNGVRRVEAWCVAKASS